MNDRLEIYIHIPFCVRKCEYCDFLSFSASEETKERYVRALLRELFMLSEKYGKRTVSSIFFGGGTPTVLPADCLIRILETVRELFSVEPDAEISAEANPGTVDAEYLSRLRMAGFNRISFGVQSTKNEELLRIGRIHSFEDFLNSLSDAEEAGFTNINADLIFALPFQSREDFAENLTTLAKLPVTHISAYGLILEEGTPLYEKRAAYAFPDEDTQALMYGDCRKILAEYGFFRYEISNYAKAGYECRHNTGYWSGVPYIGAGLGASSYMEGCRYKNTSDLKKYLELFEEYEGGEAEKTFFSGTCDFEVLSKEDLITEFMITGLRLTRGISEEEFERRFHLPVSSVYGKVIRKYCETGFMEREDGRLKITEKGLFVSNYILSDFVLSPEG